MDEMEIVKINKDDETQCIIGHAGFLSAIDDLHEAVMSVAPHANFGIAYAEPSGMKMIRSDGTDHVMMKQAEMGIRDIGAGHTFIIFFKDAFPTKVLDAVKKVSEVSNIYCATANHVYVVVMKSSKGNAVLGIIDGLAPSGIERIEDREKRKKAFKNAGKR